mmetsp:Transcript_32869/g.5978  ORF Transcript_32869/g.5978 Transcript_32869/m.5978 type:complete len:83 (+) Transcript_32869:186-434(+)
MVEIDNTTKAYCRVFPDSDVVVEIGRTSIPIKVHCPNAPYEGLTIDLTLNNSLIEDKVTFSMNQLYFIPDGNSRYFAITVDR